MVIDVRKVMMFGDIMTGKRYDEGGLGVLVGSG